MSPELSTRNLFLIPSLLLTNPVQNIVVHGPLLVYLPDLWFLEQNLTNTCLLDVSFD